MQNTSATQDTSPAFALTREALNSGLLQARVAQANPELRILTDEERERSLNDTLAARPPEASDDGVWLFAYGSLIWNPAVLFDDQRVAMIEGWHRAFCLSTPHGRGTRDNPGLLLGLDRGGACAGCAFHVGAEHMRAELSVLWRREMLSGSYVPVWVPLRGTCGTIFGHGIAFTINRQAQNYAGDVAQAERVRRIATAEGMLGSSAEYLFRTRDGLRQLGIDDPDIERLAEAVERARIAT